MNEDNISLALQHFIETERWEYPFRFVLSTELEKDLRITGDDAVEFIVAFGKEFEVDISNLQLDIYFDSEGIDFLGWVISLFRKRTSIKKVLTLGDLEKAIQIKQLI